MGGPVPAEAIDPGGAALAPVSVSEASAADWDPKGRLWVPATPKGRLEANVAALERLREIEATGRVATAADQQVLAGWSSWGALPGVFDRSDTRFDGERERLGGLLDEVEWAAAARTTINAHYTSPEVVGAVWRILGGLGFKEGRVLEPGCGSGNFIGAAPAGASMVGVELDPVTASIATHLYPSAQIRPEGFETTRLAEGSFAAAVGNVPFGKVSLFDPTFNRDRHSIHNHFIIKSLRLTAPGGLVGVVTSRYTMDAENPAARRAIARYGDLVGAIRLPGGAFKAVAGTDVVTDILVFQRREEERPDGEPFDWERVVSVEVSQVSTVEMNEWFAVDRTRTLGRVYAGRGMYRDNELMVEGDLEALPAQLEEAADRLIAEGLAAGHAWRAIVSAEPEAAGPVVGVVSARRPKPHTIAVHDGGFVQWGEHGGWEPFKVPASRHREVRELIGLRDVTHSLLDAQSEQRPPVEVEALRGELNRRYDAYVARFGIINRAKVAKNGAIRPDQLGGFRDDPDFALLQALEHVSDDVVRKAAIFTVDVVAPAVRASSAESMDDAIAICIDELAKIDPDRIGSLLGIDAEVARARMVDDQAVFIDPDSDELIVANRYLSGNVRAKLATVEAAIEDRPELEANRAALAAVVPRDLEPEEIDARPGATWIPPSDVERFCAEVFEVRASVDYRPFDSTWLIRSSGATYSPKLTVEYGTKDRNGIDLLDSALNNRPVSITVELADGRRVVDRERTLAAREKVSVIQDRFAEWIWEDPERSERLAAEYNRRFNAHVKGRYDGSRLTFPGKSAALEPHRHQRDAVARVLVEPSTLLDHVVGAGKTGVMAMAAMELRRLGLARQPWIVVPNHMLEQFSREFVEWYPNATLLVARNLKGPADRRRFVARSVASDEWDAVIITQSVFKGIPMSPELTDRYLREDLAKLEMERTAPGELGDQRGRTKALERQKLVLEQRIKALNAKATKDTGVEFDRSGCDFLIVDEAHAYKNRMVVSRDRALAFEGSGLAQDMDTKMRLMRERNPNRQGLFATATPVANSLREMWVMQSYLRPDLLAEAGVESFDSWAANFARPITRLELKPAGNGYELRTSMSRFANTPDLIRSWQQVADVVTAEDLTANVPEVAGGRQAITVRASEQLQAFVENLAARGEAVQSGRVKPEEDNMLAITNDGRMAALDPRCVGMDEPADGAKARRIATEVLRIDRENADRVFDDPSTDRPSERPGAFQIVFCDRSTPKAGQWNWYDQFAEELVAGGMDRDRIRFIHDAKTDQAKEALFAACRDGRVSVLVGSTEKMGVGTNIQTRAVALHHADCPWRPADLEQREGRAIRQGNQCDRVEIFAYATEGSFDVYMWQLVERKASFIGQIKGGDVTSRVVNDLGDQDEALSYGTIKALATGNPLIMEKAAVEAELTRLTRLEVAYRSEQGRIGRELRRDRRELAGSEDRLVKLDAALQRRVDTRGDLFSMTINDITYTNRKDAGAALSEKLATFVHASHKVNGPVGVVGGLQVMAVTDRDWDRIQLRFEGLSLPPTEVDKGQFIDPSPVLRSLEARLSGLESARDAEARNAEALRRRITQAERIEGRTFDHGEALVDARRRVAEIEELLQPPPIEDDNVAETSEPTAAGPVANRIGSASMPRPVQPPPGRPGGATVTF